MLAEVSLRVQGRARSRRPDPVEDELMSRRRPARPPNTEMGVHATATRGPAADARRQVADRDPDSEVTCQTRETVAPGCVPKACTTAGVHADEKPHGAGRRAAALDEQPVSDDVRGEGAGVLVLRFSQPRRALVLLEVVLDVG